MWAKHQDKRRKNKFHIFTLLVHSLTIMHFSLPPQIYYYADSIYASAGVKQNDIQYVTVGTGAVNVFMTIAAVSTLLISVSNCCFLSLVGRGRKLQPAV